VAKFKACVAVYGLLHRDGKLLLLRRKGSGYRDGQLSLPAGHLDGGESVVDGLRRELREELGIEVTAQSFKCVMHREREKPGDDEYVDFFFHVDTWSGTPAIQEPDKCSELVWADPDELPADVVDYIRAAVTTKEPLVLGWT
jgi:8-oxo-dGTP pyrophosphatase MutT (NUDIX family)